MELDLEMPQYVARVPKDDVVYLSSLAAYSNGQGRTRLDFTGLRHAKAFQCEQQQSFRYELNS